MLIVKRAEQRPGLIELVCMRERLIPSSVWRQPGSAGSGRREQGYQQSIRRFGQELGSLKTGAKKLPDCQEQRTCSGGT